MHGATNQYWDEPDTERQEWVKIGQFHWRSALPKSGPSLAIRRMFLYSHCVQGKIFDVDWLGWFCWAAANAAPQPVWRVHKPGRQAESIGAYGGPCPCPYNVI